MVYEIYYRNAEDCGALSMDVLNMCDISNVAILVDLLAYLF
jgi:hypothetical protein